MPSWKWEIFMCLGKNNGVEYLIIDFITVNLNIVVCTHDPNYW